MLSDPVEAVREYYDKNTRLFLWLGGSGKTQSIHRPVWGEGVTSRQEALEYTDRLVLAEAQRLARAISDNACVLGILDLGCGVGGTLFYLARNLSQPLRTIGVTISPLQAGLARKRANELGLEDQCQFLEADFLNLPHLEPVDLAFSIEAFVLAPDSERFFQQAAAILKAGGRLILCDDFLTEGDTSDSLPPEHQHWIASFRMGWHAAGLSSVQAARGMARRYGLRLAVDRDLTPCLRLNRLRDRWIAVLTRLGRHLPLRSPYWMSLVGGDALRRCLSSGLIAYRFLVFEKD